MMFFRIAPVVCARSSLFTSWPSGFFCLTFCLTISLLMLCLAASPAQAVCKNAPDDQAAKEEASVWIRHMNELDTLLAAEESFDPYDPSLPYSEGERQGVACTVAGIAGVLGALAVGGSEFMIIAGGGVLYAHSPGVLIMALFSNAYAAACATGALLEPYLMRGYEDTTNIPTPPKSPCQEP
ncbi:MAG: hypothetical protein WCP34_00805 [Pseudomonadota bacterium]